MSKGEKYYGGFFWIAVVSFLVPVIVAWRAFDGIGPTTKPTPTPDASGVDHAVWDYLLKSYVSGGLVDYGGMKRDYLFPEYLRELGAANPDALATDDERLALACNAYNAFVINGVITHKITDTVSGYSVNGIDFFDLPEHIFAGQTFSLNVLEHKMIRPMYQEPRIHVALVCAAISCPAIRGEAYVGAQIDRQLEDQSVQFANNRHYVNFNEETGQLELSQILNWYGDDWNNRYPDGGYLQWIAELVKDEQLKAAVHRAIDGQVDVTFVKYDWTLNSLAPPGQQAGGGKSSGDFGSGSIPNG